MISPSCCPTMCQQEGKTGEELLPGGPLPGRLAAEGGIRAAGLRSCLRNVLRSRPKPSVSDSSSPRLQECQRRAPLIPPVLGPRLSFVKLKISPPGTSFCQRPRRCKGDGGSVSLPDSASLLFLCQGNREAETCSRSKGPLSFLGQGQPVHLSPANWLPFALSQAPDNSPSA